MNQLAGAILFLAIVAIAGMLVMVSKGWDVSKSGYFWVVFIVVAGILAVSFLYLAASQ